MSLKFPADCLERYEPLEVIGTGGFGVVYRARDLRLERHVAIKLLHEETLRQPGQLERFLQEARSTYQISHKNIIKLLDFGFSAGAPWIVYELIEGHSLAGELSRGPLEIDRALGAIHDVALGLSASHSMGILHRDIKPENILVTEDAFKIIDFGIAKWISGSGVRTEHGFVLGTPAYMAPEQVLGQPPSESFDIYSLGISLFELLAGRVPFISENPTLVIKQHLDGVMPRPSEFNPAIPAVVDELVLRIAATRVNDRIPTAAAVAPLFM